MALFSLIIRSKLLLNISQPLKEYFSLPGWFCNKTFFITFLLLHTLEAIILSMQKKYPTNFLDPLDISEYDSNSTKDSLAYAIAPLPASSAGGLFFALRLRGAAFFLSALPPLPGATMPRNCRTGVRLA
ncbi:hypothetical protein ACLB1T_29265 [Escherichia coli]